MTTPVLDRTDSALDRQFARIVDELTRRGFLAGGLGSAALLGLAACGSSGHPSAGGSSADGWTFTDDLGRAITLPRKPSRIAALADTTAAGLWAAGLHVVASQMAPGNRAMLTSAGVPETGIAKIATGNTATINVEALAAAKPDLIIDIIYEGKLAVASQTPQVEKLAPVVGLAYGPAVANVIGAQDRLVTALGITLADDAAKARYDTAAAHLKAALAAKPGLRVAFFDVYDANLYTNGASDLPFLSTLQSLGMQFMAGSGKQFSLELVPTLPADLYLQSDGQWPIDNPAWAKTPAVAAGQVANTDDWTAGGWYLYDYANYADLFDKLTAVIQQSTPGIGPR